MEDIHDLNWKSGTWFSLCSFLFVLTSVTGMLSSWNKLCLTTGYIEVSASMPGAPTAAGLWPGMASLHISIFLYLLLQGIWTMGNLVNNFPEQPGISG